MTFPKTGICGLGKLNIFILDRVNEKKLRHRHFMENSFRFLRIKKR